MYTNNYGWTSFTNILFSACSYCTTHTQPVIDLSEAGSVSAFNSQLTKEDAPLESIFEATPQEVESGGSLASQLAAAVKKRKSSKQEQDSEKDSKSFFKRRWSSKRKSRDKGRASVSTEEQHVASPGEESERLPSTTESPGGLQGKVSNHTVLYIYIIVT